MLLNMKKLFALTYFLARVARTESQQCVNSGHATCCWGGDSVVNGGINGVNRDGSNCLLSSCCACSLGYYKPYNSGQFSSMSCSMCPPNTYTSSQGSAGCTSCSAGSFSSSGSSSCTNCATPGKQWTGSTCEQCPRGSFSSTLARSDGSYNCESCPTSIYTAAAGSISISACSICAPGYAGIVVNGGSLAATGCSVCPIGFFSNENANTCTACPTSFSTYSYGSQFASDCALCAPGYYGSVVNAGTATASGCTACPIGYTTVKVGGTSVDDCSKCVPGYIFNDLTGKCTICPAGTWGQSGMTACILCSAGTYSLSGSSSCTPCPAGTYGSSTGLKTSACTASCTSAEACPLGTVYPPPAAPISGLSCLSSGARAVPTSLGLKMLPAAHPLNSRGVDLIIASLGICQQLTSTCSTLPSDAIVGVDVSTQYIVGTSEELHMESSEQLTCTVP